MGALIPLYVQPWLSQAVQERGIASDVDALLGRFAGASTYAFVALRMFGASVGATPKGADVDLATWITFATGAVDIRFDKEGKPVRPERGALMTRFGIVALRMSALSLVSSIAQPFGGYPLTKNWQSITGTTAGPIGRYLSETCDHALVHVMMLWLFLSLLCDIGSILLIAQGFTPIEAFDNPIGASRSPREFWGKRWNFQVTTSFKRCVFTPLKKLDVPNALAALLTFISSGLFHEYQFILSFPNYTLGRISVFFVLQAFMSSADALLDKSLGAAYPFSAKSPLPAPLKTALALALFSPSTPLFSSIWIEEGMFDAFSKMTVGISL